MMVRATFMARFGPLKTKPASWQDMFFPYRKRGAG
jgi:hypothetical protein